MGKYKTEPKTKQAVAEKQVKKLGTTGALLAHKEIAMRAYEIYVANGRRQGRSEQDWLQAEQDLKNR